MCIKADLDIGGTEFNFDPLLGMIRYWRHHCSIACLLLFTIYSTTWCICVYKIKLLLPRNLVNDYSIETLLLLPRKVKFFKQKKNTQNTTDLQLEAFWYENSTLYICFWLFLPMPITTKHHLIKVYHIE